MVVRTNKKLLTKENDFITFYINFNKSVEENSFVFVSKYVNCLMRQNRSPNNNLIIILWARCFHPLTFLFSPTAKTAQQKGPWIGNHVGNHIHFLTI